VSLKNGLKVEGKTVPERKFAARRTCQDTSPLGSPLANERSK
jgi:hypothetical protein